MIPIENITQTRTSFYLASIVSSSLLSQTCSPSSLSFSFSLHYAKIYIPCMYVCMCIRKGQGLVTGQCSIKTCCIIIASTDKFIYSYYTLYLYGFCLAVSLPRDLSVWFLLGCIINQRPTYQCGFCLAVLLPRDRSQTKGTPFGNFSVPQLIL